MIDILTYGVGGQIASQLASRNFKSAPLQGLSLCTTPVELLSNDGKDTIISHASGFFWIRKGRPFLVTNYHVVSGRNAFTAEIMHPDLYVPQRIAFYGIELSVTGGVVEILRRRYLFVLDDDFHQKLLTKPPKVQDADVDLFALAMLDGMSIRKDPTRTGFSDAGTVSSMVNEYDQRSILTSAGDDCHILGYPLANYGGLMPPIWKRGSIASDTNIGVDNRPVFIIDAATTPGMSGSPIFRKANIITAENSSKGVLEEFTAFQFIGVYAGRLGSRSLEAVNLGYAWYASLIDDLIDGLAWSQPPIQFEKGQLVGKTAVE